MHGSDYIFLFHFRLGARTFSRGSALTACSHRSTTRPMPCCSNGNKETNRGNLRKRAAQKDQQKECGPTIRSDEGEVVYEFGVELQNRFRCQEFLLKSAPLHLPKTRRR